MPIEPVCVELPVVLGVWQIVEVAVVPVLGRVCIKPRSLEAWRPMRPVRRRHLDVNLVVDRRILPRGTGCDVLRVARVVFFVLERPDSRARSEDGCDLRPHLVAAG